MSASTVSPMTNATTASTTKTKEQILIQSSGAMIAIIVVGIVIILSILLIILKTYNRRMHTSRMLDSGSSKPRKNTSSTMQTQLPMENLRGSTSQGSFGYSPQPSVTGFHLPRAQVANQVPTSAEQFNTNSGFTVVTIHGTPANGHT